MLKIKLKLDFDLPASRMVIKAINHEPVTLSRRSNMISEKLESVYRRWKKDSTLDWSTKRTGKKISSWPCLLLLMNQKAETLAT